MKFLRIIGCVLLVLTLMYFVSCDTGTSGSSSDGDGGGSGLTGTELADSEVDKAAADLENGDYESAHSHYSIAVTADSSHGEALLGYSLLELMDIMTDSNIVSLARNKLGLAEYPNNMNDIMEGAWFYEYEYGDPLDLSYYYSPEITDETAYDFDGDGYLDPMEKGFAAIAFFAGHNSGFDDLIDTVSTALYSRVDSVLNVVDAIPTDAQIFIPGELTMIEDNDGAYQDLVVGRAEVQLIAASLLAFRSQVQMAQVYDYTLPLASYWEFAWDYMNGDATMDEISALATPFSGSFLEADATSKLGDAKDDMLDMRDRFNDAMNDIWTRTGATYSFSQDSILVVDEDMGSDVLMSDVWPDVQTVTYFTSSVINRIGDSIADGGGTDAVLAIIDPDSSDPIADMQAALDFWPSTGVLPDSVAVDFGEFYSSPVFAISSLVDLDNDGEPVFYQWNGTGFTETTDVPAFDGSDFFYYVKMKDISLNDTIDPAIIPQDDTSSAPYYIDYLDFYSPGDADGDGQWDNGEYVADVDCDSNVDGVIDLLTWPRTDCPAEWYWSEIDYTDSAQVTDSDILSHITLDTGSMAELRTELNNDDELMPDPQGPVAVIDTSDPDGDAVYFALPFEGSLAVAHSLTDDGDDLGVDIDEDGFNETSTGSFWWGLASMFDMME